MEEIDGLLAKGEFGKALELIGENDDPACIFRRIAALTGLDRAKEALKLLLDNRDTLYEADPVRTIKFDVELRLELKQFQEAYEDESYFLEKPYVSQLVEEAIRDIRPSILLYQRRVLSEKQDPSDVLFDEQSDDFSLLQALYALKEIDAEALRKIREIASGNRNDQLRTFALLKLVDYKDQEPILFFKNGKEYEIVPAKMNPPYSGEGHRKLLKDISSMSKDVAASSTAESLYDSYALEIYPETEEGPLLAAGLVVLAFEYLQSEPDIDEYLKANSLSFKQAEEKAAAIEEAIESSEEIAY